MAFQEAGGYCDDCNRNVMIRRQGTSHILHLFLSVITVGLWIPVWLLSSVRFGGWRCIVCGSHASSGSGDRGPITAKKVCAILFGLYLVYILIRLILYGLERFQ